jgi:glycine cleavage system H protein
MDGFTYHNIFQTKGIEYIIIIAFLLLIIPFWALISRRAQVTRNIRKALGTLTADILKIPGGLFFSKNHTWTHLERSGTAKIGLDDLLLHITGEVKLRCLKDKDDSVSKGEAFVEAEQQGKILRICSPVSGRVLESNPHLVENPGILNEDPYINGWIYKIRPTNWKDETGSYFLADEAIQWSARELERFKDFMARSTVKHSAEPSLIILQDGGELNDNPLSQMPGETWQDFQEEFLNQNN